METDPLTAATVADWRLKAQQNKLSDDELRAWIKHCREGRVAASEISAKSRAKKAPVDIDSMLTDLDNII